VISDYDAVAVGAAPMNITINGVFNPTKPAPSYKTGAFELAIIDEATLSAS
jgi:hypothetical protein